MTVADQQSSNGKKNGTEESAVVSFGTWIQRRRLALDLTRPALAQLIPCSPSTIKKIERDERRPSERIAELLADQLLIVPQERERFLAMARGEFLNSPLSPPERLFAPHLLSIRQPCDDEVPDPVAREDELALLDAGLAAAVSGDGGIFFISGEAGDGKTLLTQAFARRSQAQYPNLLAVTGSCDAYTGVGDPYLPFREILELLTGDVDALSGARSTSCVAVERLWYVAPQALAALLDVGPDLVGTLLPGASLLARAAATIPGADRALLERLNALVDRRPNSAPSSGFQQTDLFAQYTRVLRRLAESRPLLVIIDDLQWVDAGSISLLFHLSRRLRGQKILLLGIYRAAEVALGRDGSRHPLAPLINELQRTYGEIHIRLNQTDGRRFVDALVDSEPNKLDRTFRDALYRRTAGHPLFTVEMLHGLQERGDLVRNGHGEWVAEDDLDWNILPARVEGVLQERIGRLAADDQQLLEVASVSGESFDTQTLAHILALDESAVVARLERVLSREQRLVLAQGIQRVGDRQLSQYRFRHILFQQYLYRRLSPGSRAYFHGEIARELERVYGDERAQIATHLAHHYLNAGDHIHAAHYLELAGIAAADLYANAEAEIHYRRALELLETAAGSRETVSTLHRQQINLYARLGRVLELSARHDEAIETYEKMEQVARENDEIASVLDALLARAAIYTTVNYARDPGHGHALLATAHTIARALNDEAAEAKILWNLLILSAYTGGDPSERRRYADDAIALARRLNLSEPLAFALHDGFYGYAGTGEWDRALTAVEEACDLWQRLHNLPMLSEAHTRLHWASLVAGDYDRALVEAETAARLAEESHNLDAQALSHFMLGMIHWEWGELDRAIAVMEDDIAMAESVRSLTPLIGTRSDLALLYGTLGDATRGMELAAQARAVAGKLLPILEPWAHAAQVLLALQQEDVETAGELITTLPDYRTVQTGFGYMPFMWIRVGLAQGEYELRMGAYEAALDLTNSLYADVCAAGIRYLRPDVLHLTGRVLLAMGAETADEARSVLLEARTTAEELNSQRALRPILDDLSDDMTRPSAQ